MAPVDSEELQAVTKRFVAGMERFAKQEQIPVVQFRKGQRKDDVMAEHLARFDKPEGIVMLGKAQEKTPVSRTEKRRSPQTGKTYPWIARSTAMVNQYYWYCLDRDFGPFFLKSHRYRVTDFGLRAALYFTRVHARLYRPAVAHILPTGPPVPSGLQRAFHKLESEIDQQIRQAKLAA